MLKKQIDKKDKIDCKIYDVSDWTTSNCNTYILQYRNQTVKPDNEV